MKTLRSQVKKWLKHWYETNAGAEYCKEFSIPEAREEEKAVYKALLHFFDQLPPTAGPIVPRKKKSKER